ncbi:MAG: ribosome hibernation-promoting factor, HPF/YfiA family [Euzebya sp.]
MDIILRARNCEVPAKIKDEARRKVEHATRIFDRIIDLEVSFSEEHNPRIPDPASVEITARSKGHTVRAVGAGVDHHEATDKAIARLERQLRRYKTRLVDRGRRSKAEEARAGGEVPPVYVAHNGHDEEDPEPQIVRRKQFELAAMDPEDAVLQLELLGHDFYLFANASTGQPNVVYHREGGDIGLIEGVMAAAGAQLG